MYLGPTAVKTVLDDGAQRVIASESRPLTTALHAAQRWIDRFILSSDLRAPSPLRNWARHRTTSGDGGRRRIRATVEFRYCDATTAHRRSRNSMPSARPIPWDCLDGQLCLCSVKILYA